MAEGTESSSSTAARRADRERSGRFEHLFDAHFRAVSAYAHRRTSHAQAEDAVAETFLVAWRRLDDISSDPKPWLLGVARRVLANQHRAAGRRAALTERIAGELRSEEEAFARPPIIEALERLSDSDREVLLLFAWDGLSSAEAATTLDCSRTAAKVRLHRARGRLRAELQRLERGEMQLTIPDRLKGVP